MQVVFQWGDKGKGVIWEREGGQLQEYEEGIAMGVNKLRYSFIVHCGANSKEYV